MNLKKFDKISGRPRTLAHLVWQDWEEWRIFLEFADAYFKNRGVKNPLVVEIGVMHNEQQIFYKELLGARYIGIDIQANNEPDILGDSHKPETMQKLHGLLKGGKIDLLFIDGNHSYESVKRDYERYGALTEHIIAFHDISATVNSDVLRFWQDLSRGNGYLAIAINRCNTSVSVKDNKYVDMGIGLIIKERV